MFKISGLLKFLGVGAEGAAYRYKDKVIKAVRAEGDFKTPQDVNSGFARKASTFANKGLTSIFPEKVEEYDGKLIMITPFIKGLNFSQIANREVSPELLGKTGRKIWREGNLSQDPNKYKKSFNYLAVSAGKDYDDLKNLGFTHPDVGPNNFILTPSDRLVNIDPGYGFKTRTSPIWNKLKKFYMDQTGGDQDKSSFMTRRTIKKLNLSYKPIVEKYVKETNL